MDCASGLRRIQIQSGRMATICSGGRGPHRFFGAACASLIGTHKVPAMFARAANSHPHIFSRQQWERHPHGMRAVR